MQEMDAAVSEAIEATGRVAGSLRINTLGMAARQFIAPRLGRFHRAYPQVVLDIVAGHFDAGICVGKRLEKDMIAVRLSPDVKMVAVASPEYLSRHGEPKGPADLHRHACINWRFPGSGAIHRWEFERRGKKVEISVEGPFISNHQDIVVEAALQGLGILYTYDIGYVHDAIERGELKCVLTEWSTTLPGLFLYHPSRRLPQAALRAFINCLLELP